MLLGKFSAANLPIRNQPVSEWVSVPRSSSSAQLYVPHQCADSFIEAVKKLRFLHYP